MNIVYLFVVIVASTVPSIEHLDAFVALRGFIPPFASFDVLDAKKRSAPLDPTNHFALPRLVSGLYGY